MEQRTPQYEVGRLYHPEKTSWLPGTDFNYRKSEDGERGVFELRMFLDHMTSGELLAITNGRAAFAYTYLDGVIYFLYQFNGSEWGDSSYTIHMVPDTDLVYPSIFQAGESGTLFIIVVRAETGIVEGMRLIHMPRGFTRAILADIESQLQVEYDSMRHASIISKAYTEYPYPHLMLSRVKHSFSVAEKTTSN